MEFLFGLTRLILGVTIALFAFKVFKPKEGKFIAKNPTLSEILAIVLVISGIYSIINYFV